MTKNVWNVLAAVALFVIIAIGASAITVSALWGAKGQTFTLFEFLGPLPAAFLGPVAGIGAILLAKLASIAVLHTPLDMVTVLRLLPPVAAAFFFATYRGKMTNGTGSNWTTSRAIQVLVPLACMALFILHPVGAQAWFYSLYWLIPPVVVLALPDNLFLRSLGTTFTQHAIGGVIWLYFVNAMTPAAWIALIPIVAVERLVFAGGMSACFVLLQAALAEVNSVLVSRHVQPLPLLCLPKADQSAKTGNAGE
ncbi:MAG: hypothetical protein V1728_02725 [Candidatus Micrarchaeota archaeon]